MADTEFEQFRQYFDQLPQYIKAPADCYTLVPNIDLDAESPSSVGCKGENRSIPKILIPSISENLPSFSLISPTINSVSNGTENEPFSGDLQVISLDIDDSLVNPRIVNKSPFSSTGTPRKRRKLPEVPKRKNELLQCHQQGYHQHGRQLSLAEELINAEKNMQVMDALNHCDSTSALHDDSSVSSLNCNKEKNHFRDCSYNYHGNEPTHAYGKGSGSRPFLLLKTSQESSSHDDESSSDSEKYPSIDSGHSTIHSDDGIKQYSSQVLSLNESFSPCSPTNTRVPVAHLEVLEATHRGLHRFIPRHHDEIEVDIGDPIYVQKEADDLWCEGVNLRTGLQGIFPSAYVVDVEYNDFDPSANKVKKERYLLNYLGSIETLYHKGNEVLCQAVKKIAKDEKYVASHARSCILEISDQGIQMSDKGKLLPNHVLCHDYFYALKNVSFCGFHPTDHRYFCFVTKHPTMNRFACHVFISEESTRPVAEAVGRAFQRFYQKFLETAYPIEDIYLE